MGFHGAELIRAGESRAVRRAAPEIVDASPENPSTNLADPASWFVDWASGGHPGAFGPHVSERTAMCCSAVFRAVAILSGVVAGLPLKIYRRTRDGREAVPEHGLQSLLQVCPFPGRAMTSFVWRELWMVNELLWGDHFSILRYNGAGEIIGFEHVMPWDCEVYRVRHRSRYRCVLWDYSFGPTVEGVSQRIEWVDQDDMIHIPGIGFNGVRGMSRIRAFARDAISIALLLQEHTGMVHQNGAMPTGMMTLPRMKSDAFKVFKAQFNEQNTGRINAGKVIFADKDATFTPFKMSMQDMMTIDAQRFQVADVSRFFGVPLHLLNETDKSTSWGTGLSEQTLAFLIYTLDPDLGRIEAELNYKLFYNTDHYVEFDRDALMAMDPVKAAEVARAEIASGSLLINERRRHKNRPPVEFGDQPLINSTNVPLAKIFAPAAQPLQDPIGPGPAPADSSP